MLWSSHDAITQSDQSNPYQPIPINHQWDGKITWHLHENNVTQKKRLFNLQPMKWLPSPLSFFHWPFIGRQVWVPVPFWRLTTFPAHPVSSNFVRQLTKLLWSKNFCQYVRNLATCHDVNYHDIAIKNKLSQFACRCMSMPKQFLISRSIVHPLH